MALNEVETTRHHPYAVDETIEHKEGEPATTVQPRPHVGNRDRNKMVQTPFADC